MPVKRFKGSKQRGFQGIKLLYVPEEEAELQIGGMEKAFGRSVKESEAITALLIDGASSHGMLVLFHADLRKYGDLSKRWSEAIQRRTSIFPILGHLESSCRS